MRAKERGGDEYFILFSLMSVFVLMSHVPSFFFMACGLPMNTTSSARMLSLMSYAVMAVINLLRSLAPSPSPCPSRKGLDCDAFMTERFDCSAKFTRKPRPSNKALQIMLPSSSSSSPPTPSPARSAYTHKQTLLLGHSSCCCCPSSSSEGVLKSIIITIFTAAL